MAGRRVGRLAGAGADLAAGGEGHPQEGAGGGAGGGAGVGQAPRGLLQGAVEGVAPPQGAGAAERRRLGAAAAPPGARRRVGHPLQGRGGVRPVGLHQGA